MHRDDRSTVGIGAGVSALCFNIAFVVEQTTGIHNRRVTAAQVCCNSRSAGRTDSRLGFGIRNFRMADLNGLTRL